MGSIIIAGIVGALLGAFISWVWVSKRSNAELSTAKTEAAVAIAEKNKTEENLKTQIAMLEVTEQKMREVFDSAALSALKSSNQHFLELAETNFKTLRTQASSDLDARKNSVEQLIAPIREALDKVSKETKELENKRIQETGKIGEELLQLANSNEKLQSATSSLLNALKSPKIRGRWGEIALRNLVEMAGMSSLCDFNEQSTVVVQGSDVKQRPDMIVNLPGGRHVPVDSKVPLDAFMKAMEAVDDEQRAIQLKLHAVHTRNHVKALAKSAYHENIADAELVVMFIPNDTFLAVAAEQDPDLIQFGIEQKVMIATPSTLFALLKAISYWDRQFKFTENAKNIQELAVGLVDRIATFTEHLEKMRDKLAGAVDSCNDAVRSWQSRLWPHADKIKELGAGGTKSIPEIELIHTVPAQLKEKNQK